MGKIHTNETRHTTDARATPGRRLAHLRKAAGLTQTELAQRLGVTQSNIAFWEHSAKPPRSDVLPAMAQALGTSVEVLLDVNVAPAPPGRRTHHGPTGKVKEVFERVSRLPRRQQEKVIDFVSAYVTQYEQNRQG